MNTADLLSDAARRPLESADVVLKDLSEHALHAMPEDRCNSIAWLIWHAARQQDVQLAELSGRDEVWVDGWADRLGVHRGVGDFGFGDDVDAVRALHAKAGPLRDYLAAVVEALVEYVAELSAEDLSEIVDRRWDPPVTRGVRLVSVIDDAVAHLGQAAYVRGLVDGWSIGY